MKSFAPSGGSERNEYFEATQAIVRNYIFRYHVCFHRVEEYAKLTDFRRSNSEESQQPEEKQAVKAA